MNKNPKILIAALTIVTSIFSILPANTNTAYAAVTGEKKDEFSEILDDYEDYVEYYYYLDYDADKMKNETLNDASNDWSEEQLLKDYFSKLDPWSGYFTVPDYSELTDSMSGSFFGIGATVEKSDKPKGIKIVKTLAESPAKKAGLKAGDVIVRVDGMDVTGIDLDEGVALMRGEKGTTVKVTYKRKNSAGKYRSKTVTITRDEIKVDTVSTKYYKTYKVGYVRVTDFGERTDEEFDSAITKLAKKGMKGLVIDLRDNPGGYIDTAVNMAGRILPADTLVTTLRDKNGGEEVYTTPESDNNGKDKTVNVPIVILINENSASASELLTGCLMDDYDDIEVIGTRSYGKGVAQGFLPDGEYVNGERILKGYVKLTTAGYFTPSGLSIHGIGIKPDITVKNTKTSTGKIVDKQLKKAIKELEKN